MPTQAIEGQLSRIIFPSQNDSANPFLIAVLKDGTKIKGPINNLVKPGYNYELVGDWQEDAHGKFFFVKEVTAVMPTSADGTIKWLSELFEGIGPQTAKAVWNAFGKGIFDVLDREDVTALSTINGIGPKKAKKLCDIYKNDVQKHTDIFVKFYQYGFTTWEITKIVSYFSAKQVDPWEGINKNPYSIVKAIEGIGFRRADKIALERLRFKKDNQMRIKAAICYVLQICQDIGHVYLLAQELREKLEGFEIILDTDATYAQYLKELELEGFVILDGDKIYDAKLYYQEQAIAKKLKDFMHKTGFSLSEISISDILKELTQEQQYAVKVAIENYCCILTGPPGTGKSFTVKRIIRMLSEFASIPLDRIGLAAPTGKAAKVLQDYIGDEFPQLTPKTVHRLLSYRPDTGDFDHNDSNPLPYQLIIIDETSMLDTGLLYHLTKAVAPNTRLIFLGDVDQLPSVGPGRVLHDMIASEKIPYVRFTKIIRQKGTSGIVYNAVERINKGLQIAPNEKDFFYLQCGSEEETVRKVVKLVTQRLPEKFGYDPKMDVQVICPTKKGLTGTHNLNQILRERLTETGSQSVEFGFKTFAIGDKIVNTKNDYYKPGKEAEQEALFREDVFNGYTGIVESIGGTIKSPIIVVDYGDAKRRYKIGKHEHLDYAYAMTAHRTQGSEYKCVVVVISKAFKSLLRRSVLYTAVTRGKECVILVGDAYNVDLCISNAYAEPRNTTLRELLQT